jgi:hypothetical protein
MHDIQVDYIPFRQQKHTGVNPDFVGVKTLIFRESDTKRIDEKLFSKLKVGLDCSKNY